MTTYFINKQLLSDYVIVGVKQTSMILNTFSCVEEKQQRYFLKRSLAFKSDLGSKTSAIIQFGLTQKRTTGFFLEMLRGSVIERNFLGCCPQVTVHPYTQYVQISRHDELKKI